MATLENATFKAQANFFSNTANQLPYGMIDVQFSMNDSNGLFGLGVGNGIIDLDNENLIQRTLITNDPYTLSTSKQWNYTVNNMSSGNIDDNTSASIASIRRSVVYSNEVNYRFENPFKISLDALDSANNYTKYFTYANTSIIDIGVEPGDKPTGENDKHHYVTATSPVTESLFNPFIALNVRGMMENIPLINTTKDSVTVETENDLEKMKTDGGAESSYMGASAGSGGSMNINLKEDEKDSIFDCSIRKLVELSTTELDNEHKSITKLGMARYKWADFMYCKDLGKYSNNMLITLRKFPHPIGDNIFKLYGYGDEDPNDTTNSMSMAPDIGRMIAWLGHDNKLEDIIKFNYNESWKQMTAEQPNENEQDTNADQTGLIGSIINMGNPKYMKAYSKGIAGSGNTVMTRLTQSVNSFVFPSNSIIQMSNSGTYENNPAMNGKRYDAHKIYTKQGTIQDTHMYEGIMKFSHEFTLTFNYELRAYENINPKSAFLDLLANILTVTYRKGSFWGGEHPFYGAPGNGNRSGWKTANALINNIAGGAGDVTQFLFGQKNGNDLLNSLKNRGTQFADTLGIDTSSFSAAANSIIGKLTGKGGGSFNINKFVEEFVAGGLKNGLGRPQVYAFNSLLTGDPVGLWHVTIGNPRNPILAMGNLIIKDTSFQMYGPLGLDDFPTGIKVTVSLMHAKSRDAAEIANMFTAGSNSIAFKLIGGTSTGAPEQFLSDDGLLKKFGTKDLNKIISSMASV